MQLADEVAQPPAFKKVVRHLLPGHSATWQAGTGRLQTDLDHFLGPDLIVVGPPRGLSGVLAILMTGLMRQRLDHFTARQVRPNGNLVERRAELPGRESARPVMAFGSLASRKSDFAARQCPGKEALVDGVIGVVQLLQRVRRRLCGIHNSLLILAAYSHALVVLLVYVYTYT